MAIVLHSGLHKSFARTRERALDAVDPSRYREFVFRCALAVCGEAEGAEDVAQEVLLILFRTHRRLEQTENPNAWVRRVTVRCAIRHLKRHRPHDPLKDTLEAPQSSSDSTAVFAVLQRLAPEQRALLGMALSQGLSYREIGESLGIPEGTVASRLNAAKKTFQRMWEQ